MISEEQLQAWDAAAVRSGAYDTETTHRQRIRALVAEVRRLTAEVTHLRGSGDDYRAERDARHRAETQRDAALALLAELLAWLESPAYQGTVGMAAAHGYQCSEEDSTRGGELWDRVRKAVRP